MVMPEQGADVMALRDLMSQMGTDLGNLPDRSTLAKEQMDLYNTEAQEMLDQRVRGIGREAAAFGRIGSGVTTSKVGDAYAEAEKNRAREEARLANETAGLRQRDMLGALSGISSIQSLLSGQDVGRRNEVRGERGYANNLAQQQLQNRIQQWMTEQNALGMDQDLMMAIAQMSGNWGNQQPNWPQHPNYPGGGGY